MRATMQLQGCERKFDVKKFVARYPPAAANAARFSASTSNSGTKAKGKTMDSFLKKG